MTLLDFLIGVLVLSASVFWYRVCSSRSGSSLGAVVLHARKPDQHNLRDPFTGKLPG